MALIASLETVTVSTTAEHDITENHGKHVKAAIVTDVTNILLHVICHNTSIEIVLLLFTGIKMFLFNVNEHSFSISE